MPDIAPAVTVVDIKIEEVSASQSSSTGKHKRDENLMDVEDVANKKANVTVKQEPQSEDEEFDESDDDEEDEEESEEMKQLREKMRIENEEKEKKKAEEEAKLATAKANNKNQVWYILIENRVRGEEVSMMMFRTSAIQTFTKEELIWRIAFFEFPETFTVLNEKFPTTPGQPCPFQFLCDLVKNKKKSAWDFKSCQMVAKFSPDMTSKGYKKLKNAIIDYINTGPEADRSPGKTVMLDRRTHDLTETEYEVIKHMASLHQTRLKTDDEIKMDKNNK